ncbi:MAG: hypothetical protein MI892_04975 [Desulfobacterales bacterium]|nr:hypothetical protein [Desulfobacterales bacterium]
MIDYYCWIRNIGSDDFHKILKNSSICDENNCKYNEKSAELCMLTSQNKLQINNIEDIFNDLESIVDKKLDCHINVQDTESKAELSVVQQNGVRSIKRP